MPPADNQQQQQQQGIIDELNKQVAALREEIASTNGINTELGNQVNSLSWLLRTSQDETQAQAAEVARLQASNFTPTPTPTPTPSVSSVEGRICLSNGEVIVFAR